MTREEEAIWRSQSSTFNYYAGYYSNGSMMICLLSFALGSARAPVPTLAQWLGYAISGVAVWTMMEYWFHRLPYHHGPKVIVMGHTMHHETPRALLGMPYYVTAMWYMPLYLGLSYVFNPAKLAIFMAFFGLGYIGYCGVHHGTHHWRFKNRLFKWWKTHHTLHHHHPEKNFAITMPLWDSVFGTKIS